MVIAFIISTLLLLGFLFICNRYLVKKPYPFLSLSVIAFISILFIALQYSVDILVNPAVKEKPIETVNVTSQPAVEFNPYESAPSLSVTEIPFHRNQLSLKVLAGLNQPKQDLAQLMGFIQDPEKFKRLGAKPPKGLLLYGPSGTGKTLLAKAIAGEARVNLFAVSGSSFEESYVGIGAARMRELFALARKNTPAIILIDDIDALAPAHGNEPISASHRQTVNQLLSEMDHIDETKNHELFLIGTTNRIEALDQGLLRPGRFDWQVHVPLPSDKDRKEIIEKGLKMIKASPELNVSVLSDKMIGLSSADIVNVINEAAIFAAVNNKKIVDNEAFNAAFKKVSAYEVEISPILSATIVSPNEIKTNFASVAGMNEAKTEVAEIVDFLRNPVAFTRLGAKPPKGIIIYGPPGTGKTLMARAIAGEAKATFIAVSGAEFEDKYVGVGAQRVKELFKLARKYSPCIVFIDEIDALLSARGNEQMGYHDQVVNQFLNEMDNIQESKNEGIIFIGATNRVEAIDPAVLRPGRFDRKVYFRLPSVQERADILKLYCDKVRLAPDVNIKTLAQITVGYSGADLANLVNEAAIEATRKNKASVDMASFEEANDRIVLGVRQASSIVTAEDRLRTAYHEAGHALAGLLNPNHPRTLHKMTIGIRGNSLGVTHFKMQTEHYSYTRKEFEAMIATAFGGYVAEELIYGFDNVSAGAAGDLENANRIVREMVGQFALGDTPNYLTLEVFPEDITSVIGGSEVILKRQYEVTKTLLTKNRDKLDLLAKALMERETMDYEEIVKLLQITP